MSLLASTALSINLYWVILASLAVRNALNATLQETVPNVLKMQFYRVALATVYQALSLMGILVYSAILAVLLVHKMDHANFAKLATLME